MCDKICVSKIAERIRNYKLKKLLETGTGGILGIEINEEQVEKLLSQNCCDYCDFYKRTYIKTSENQQEEANKINLQKILNKTAEKEIHNLLNLKNRV